MKGLIILNIILISLTTCLSAQQIKIFAYDSLSNEVDSVVFGFHPNATLGVDELLGEQALPAESNDIYDLRVLQRTQEEFDCLYDGNYEPIYYETGFDSKVNLRPITSLDDHLIFEVLNVTENFDGGFCVALNDYADVTININEYFLGLTVAIDECPPYNLNYEDTFVNIPLFSMSGFIILPDLPFNEVNKRFFFKILPDTTLTIINTVQSEFINVSIYPNPTKGLVYIDYNNADDIEIEIYNALGKLLSTDSKQNNQIDLSNYASGLYFVKCLNNKRQQTLHRIIKVD